MNRPTIIPVVDATERAALVLTGVPGGTIVREGTNAESILWEVYGPSGSEALRPLGPHGTGGGGGSGSGATAGVYHVEAQAADGAAASLPTSAAWNTRALGTVVDAGITGASLASNEVTLPAGTYDVWFWGVAFRCNHFQIRLRDTTDAVTLARGTSGYAASGTGNPGDLGYGFARVVLDGTETIALQQYVQTGSTSAGGFSGSTNSVGETYAGVVFREVVATGTVPVREETGTAYTIVSADSGRLLRFTAAGLVTVTCDSGVDVGTDVRLLFEGAAGGDVVAGTGTVHGGGTVAQHGIARIVVSSTDTYHVH